jgi:hypothetical protein
MASSLESGVSGRNQRKAMFTLPFEQSEECTKSVSMHQGSVIHPSQGNFQAHGQVLPISRVGIAI